MAEYTIHGYFQDIIVVRLLTRCKQLLKSLKETKLGSKHISENDKLYIFEISFLAILISKLSFWNYADFFN